MVLRTQKSVGVSYKSSAVITGGHACAKQSHASSVMKYHT